MPALQPHQQRVLDELTELQEKTGKLDQFITPSPLYAKVPFDEQDRLTRQLEAMRRYAAILQDRIAHF